MTAQTPAVSKSKVGSRPISTYSQNQKTLTRIKSELETIQERKEDKLEIDSNPYGNIMVDESYSFSLRNFEKQASNKNLSNPGEKDFRPFSKRRNQEA